MGGQEQVRRIHAITPEYTRFAAPDSVIVGDGIDYTERCRHLPAICRLALPTSDV